MKPTKDLTPDEVRELWAEALESGEFPKGVGQLKTSEFVDGKVVDQYCCLGVLGVLAKRCGVIPRNLRWGYATVLQDKWEPVRKWAGLQNAFGGFENPTGSLAGGKASISTLAYLNDKGGKDFKEIAAIIRSKPPGLFHE